MRIVSLLCCCSSIQFDTMTPSKSMVVHRTPDEICYITIITTTKTTTTTTMMIKQGKKTLTIFAPLLRWLRKSLTFASHINLTLIDTPTKKFALVFILFSNFFLKLIFLSNLLQIALSCLLDFIKNTGIHAMIMLIWISFFLSNTNTNIDCRTDFLPKNFTQ